MTDHPFLLACQQYGLAIDANTLNIVLVGMVSPDHIATHKSTCHSSSDDYYLITKLISICRQIVVSPYIIPEVSNTLPLDLRPKNKKQTSISRFLAPTISFLNDKKVIDYYTSFKQMLSDPKLAKLGFTDLSLVELAKEGYAVLTNDWQLHNNILSENLQAMTIAGLRAQRALASK